MDIQKINKLTPMQEGIFWHVTTSNKSRAYFEQSIITIAGPLDVRIVEKSFYILFERHDTLRSVFFKDKKKQPFQVIVTKVQPSFQEKDLTNADKMQQENEVRHYLEEVRDEGFDIFHDVLLKLIVFRLADKCYKIIWSYHHIILDGWSMSLLWEDFMQIYRALLFDYEIPQSRDEGFSLYAQWLQQTDKSFMRKYWQDNLAGYKNNVKLPRQCFLSRKEYIHEEYLFNLGREQSDLIYKLSKTYNVTAGTVVQAVWALLLAQYSGKKDIVYGLVVSGRNAPVSDINNIAGMFINTVPIRINIDQEDLSLEAFFTMVQSIVMKANENSSFPLYEMQSICGAEGSIFDHIVLIENQYQPDLFFSAPDDAEIFQITEYDTYEQNTYDFSIYFILEDSIHILIKYNAAVYQKEFITNLTKQYEEFVFYCKEHKGIGKKCLPEREMAYVETAGRQDYQGILLRIERMAQIKNDTVAVVYHDESITYTELVGRAYRIAEILLESGVKKNEIIAVACEKSIDYITGVLAIFAAGCAFLPLMSDEPLAKVQYMLTDCSIRFVLTGNDTCIENYSDCRCIPLKAEIINEDKRKFNIHPDSNDLAYVIYTSGSTGKPKGVMVTHKALDVFFQGIIKVLMLEEGKTFLSLSNCTFDISILEMILSLACGMKVVLLDEYERRNTRLIRNKSILHNCSILQITPSGLSILLSDMNQLDYISYYSDILIGGEMLDINLINKLKTIYDGRIWNLYGPTEATIWCSIQNITNANFIDIGTPIPGYSIYVLNEERQVVPCYAEGEICIGGDALSKGYLNNQELTDQKFIPHPWKAGEVIYRTGDIGYMDQNHSLQILGRMDEQVKVMGHRIELKEIENVITMIPEINRAAVVVAPIHGQNRLIAFYEAEEDFRQEQMNNILSRNLPVYMLPFTYLRVVQLPINSNGKTDKQELLKKIDIMLQSQIEYKQNVEEVNPAIRDIVCKYCEGVSLNMISMDTSLQELGINSFSFIQIVVALEDVFNFSFKAEELNVQEYATISDIVKVVMLKMEEK